MSKKMKETGKCCICGERYVRWGNNPWPVIEDDNKRCCDSCDTNVVIPERIRRVYRKRNPNCKESV